MLDIRLMELFSTSVLGQQRKSATTILMSVKRPKAEVADETPLQPFRAYLGVGGVGTFTLRLAAVMLETEARRTRHY